MVLYGKSNGSDRGGGVVSFFRTHVWPRFGYLFPSISTLGMVAVAMVALSKNVAPSIGFFPWFFSGDDRANFVCSDDWGDGDGILDFGLVYCIALPRDYHLGSGRISIDDRIDCPALAEYANPLDSMVKIGRASCRERVLNLV